MKRKIYAIFTVGLLWGSASVFAQKDNVGIGTTSPDASAVLDIQSSNKGLLIPRMSLDQRKSVNRPATGLMIYQTDEKAGFYFYNGDDWKPLTEAVGNAKAVALDVDNWSKNGDAVSSTNFIGTTNGQALRFRVNNVHAGSINRFGGGNTYIGYESGLANVGYNNTGFGFNTLKSGTSASNNVAFGNYALSSNVTGSGNAAFGYFALKNNIGRNNLAMGSFTLELNVSGNSNLAIGNTAMRNKTSGNNNVAIGAAALESNFTGTGNVAIGYTAGYTETGSNKLYISNSESANPLIKGDFAANNLQVNSKTTGYLAIGDFTTATSASPGTGGLPLPANIGQASGYRLVVQDGILCEKVKVALRATGSTDWADYVFEPEYKTKMMSLENLEKYIHANKHLPNVPSTAEVQKEGLDFHQTSRMFMEKIEELTLYMIDMKKEINALKSENEALKLKK
jgi:hypothetical protein